VSDHPDREQLAAWQAGDLGDAQRGRLAAHLAGCAACASTVADLESARERLAVLAEPELPAGFHERLMAAVERELPAARPARRASAARRRRAAWFQRPGTLAAAAVLLLFAVGVLGLVRIASDHSGGAAATASRSDSGGDSGGGGGALGPSVAATDSGGLPTVRLSGEFTPARLQEAIDVNPAARRALLAPTTRAAAPGAPSSATQSGRTYGAESDSAGRKAAQDACVDQVLREAGATGLQPAFFVDTLFHNRPARLLVASVPGVPGQARFFIFQDGNCATVDEGTVQLR
jgi:anti-sigma factor RsiW